ncbi:phage holin family protein [Streptomyces sp. NPDC050617]|uniref:phage holin family protein n=1 Tax=Streptomyces sp. NPDC050617 TaxID=3154628 RepID=UPI0034302F12
MDEGRQKRIFFGTLLGMVLAAYLPTGITLGERPIVSLFVGGIVFSIVNKLILTYPSEIRSAPPITLLILGLVGIVQDSLIWLLASWLVGTQLEAGLHVDGFGGALLGGVVVRAAALACLAIPTRKAKQTSDS